MTPNPDYTVWTIKLRPNIKFHDGTPLDFAALKLQLDKDVASFLVGQAFKSVDLDRDRRRPDGEGEHEGAVGGVPRCPRRPGRLHRRPRPAQRHGRRCIDGQADQHRAVHLHQEWVRDDHLTVGTKNPNYWRKDVAFPDTITFRPIPDDQTRLASIQSGQLDLMDTIVASQILSAWRARPWIRPVRRRLADHDDDEHRRRPGRRCAGPPGAGPRHRPEGADQGRRSGPEQAGHLAVPARFAVVGPSGYPESTDVTKAKGLIDAYKQDKGISGGPQVHRRLHLTPSNTQGMELVKAQWAKIGVSHRPQVHRAGDLHQQRPQR